MRSIALIALGLVGPTVRAQWHQLQPHYEIVGFHTLSHHANWVVMTGCDNGFIAESADPPGSSGPGFWIHHSNNDWSTEAVIGGGGGGLTGSCCMPSLLDTYPPATVYYYVNESYPVTGPLHALSSESGVTVHQIWPYYAAAIHRMSAMSASALFAIQYMTYGTFFAVRRTAEEAVYIGPVPGIPYQLDFLDTAYGAMLTDMPQGQRELLVTFDGGNSWETKQYDPLQNIRHVQWGPDESLWLAGSNGLVMRSLDYGEAWDTLQSFTGGLIHSVSAYDSDSVWVSGPEGIVAYTGDAGVNWTMVPLQDSLTFRVQVFPGAVYATSTSSIAPFSGNRRIYRYGALVPDTLTTQSVNWWANDTEGIRLLLNPGETITAAQFSDVAGRLTRTEWDGSVLQMRSLATGVYYLLLSTSTRNVATKLMWSGLD